MPPSTWRRQHGPEIVAEVEDDDRGRWRASAWLVRSPIIIVRSPRVLTAFTSAQAEADHLARITFDHTCDLHTCGDWTYLP